jgi:RsiW-degrading membrane proteinase PrsW (M82 family)
VKEEVLNLLVLSAVLVAVLPASLLAAEIHSLFPDALVRQRLEAPLVEEFLKVLGLLMLALAYRRGVRKMPWLEAEGSWYALGYVCGLLFGVVENFGYGEFGGLRFLALFSHALGSGLVGLGLYWGFFRRRGGWGILAYSAAVLLHSLWNTASPFPFRLEVQGLCELMLGLLVFPFLLARSSRQDKTSADKK